MKGILTLEQEIRGARTRLLKLCDTGRLGTTSEATRIASRIDTLLKEAGLLSGTLRQYEVGRKTNDPSVRPNQES